MVKKRLFVFLGHNPVIAVMAVVQQAVQWLKHVLPVLAPVKSVPNKAFLPFNALARPVVVVAV